MRYWIEIVSRSHVHNGIAGGFTEADEGRRSRLQRLTKGDRVVFYSPRTERDGGEPVQRFTAIGEVLDDAPFEAGAALRRRMSYAAAAEAPVHPLIEQLEFISNKKSWGVAFRRGFFEIAERDFERIADAMKANLLAAQGAPM